MEPRSEPLFFSYSFFLSFLFFSFFFMSFHLVSLTFSGTGDRASGKHADHERGKEGQTKKHTDGTNTDARTGYPEWSQQLGHWEGGFFLCF